MTRRAMALATPRIHHDALDWVRRVVANGGSCSQSTLRAASAFCDSIDRAGIRDRFYRLNLFAGNSDASLNAVRTPLFRNWSAYAGRNLLSSGDNLTLSTWAKSGTTTAISSSERPFTYGPFASVVTAVAGTGVTPHVVNSANNYGYGTVTVSAYLKANGQNTVRILPVGSSGMTFPGGGAVAFATINLSNGAISNVLSGTTATATSVGNGWYRLAYTFTNNGVGNMGIRFDVGGGSSYNATGSESFFIWGIQSELGSSASAYEPFPLGSTMDTNVNFVQGDYAETGASGGLTGADTASAKRLDTGVAISSLTSTDFHASAYVTVVNTASSFRSFMGASSTNGFLFGINASGGSPTTRFNFLPANGILANTHPAAMYLGTQTANKTGAVYLNGSLASSTYTTADNTDGAFSAGNGSLRNIRVMTENRDGDNVGFYRGTLGGYSFGPGMTAAQALAYYTAMQAFQTALGRQV